MGEEAESFKASVTNVAGAATERPCSAKKKIYRSVQIRAIGVIEGLVLDATTIIEASCDAQGMGSLTSAKVDASLKRLGAKLESTEFTDQAQAKNTRAIADTGEQEDLEAKGKDMLRQAIDAKDKLSLLSTVLRGMEATDECELEYSPIYLLRAISDAKAASMAVPTSATVEAIRRQMRSALRDSPTASMAPLDPAVDMACGVCLLRTDPELEAAQTTLGIDVLGFFFV